MENKKINLTEDKLRQIVAECIVEAINESELEEGFWDNLKSGWKGAKQGFNYQKAMDRGTNGFKQEHDYDDTRRSMTNPLYKPENTAQEQAEQLLAQAKEYQAMANRLKAQANALTKKYALAKNGVNQRASTAQPTQAPVPAMSQGQGRKVKSNIPTRKVPQNVGQPLTV